MVPTSPSSRGRGAFIVVVAPRRWVRLSFMVPTPVPCHKFRSTRTPRESVDGNTHMTTSGVMEWTGRTGGGVDPPPRLKEGGEGSHNSIPKQHCPGGGPYPRGRQSLGQDSNNHPPPPHTHLLRTPLTEILTGDRPIIRKVRDALPRQTAPAPASWIFGLRFEHPTTPPYPGGVSEPTLSPSPRPPGGHQP